MLIRFGLALLLWRGSVMAGCAFVADAMAGIWLLPLGCWWERMEAILGSLAQSDWRFPQRACVPWEQKADFGFLRQTMSMFSSVGI